MKILGDKYGTLSYEFEFWFINPHTDFDDSIMVTAHYSCWDDRPNPDMPNPGPGGESMEVELQNHHPMIQDMEGEVLEQAWDALADAIKMASERDYA